MSCITVLTASTLPALGIHWLFLFDLRIRHELSVSALTHTYPSARTVGVIQLPLQMSRKLIVVLVILGNILLAFIIFIALLLGPGRKYFHKAVAPLQPGVLQGSALFSKSTFLTHKALGDISEIRTGWPATLNHTAITVVGIAGADFLDSNGLPRRNVLFDTRCYVPARVMKLDAEGTYAFLTHEENLACPAKIYDSTGKSIWSQKPKWGAFDSAAGNTSGDPSGPDAYSIGIAQIGLGGLLLFNQSGQLWAVSQPNVWHVEFLDVNSNGRDEILHSEGQGHLIVRDSTGKFLADYTPDFFVMHFSITRWGSESTPTHILVPSQNPISIFSGIIAVLDRGGHKVAEFPSPNNVLFNRAYGTSVNFGPGADDFAVIVSNYQSRNSMLLIYDPQQKIVYQESLRSMCEGISAIPAQDKEELLLGCTGTVWRYAPAGAPPAARPNSDEPLKSRPTSN